VILEEKINNLLLNEFSLFPKSEVQDYYKLLFQSVFGAEHMIKDYNTCYMILENEISQIKADSNCSLYYDISLEFPLVRVNLSRCKAENISINKISNAFFESTKFKTERNKEKFEFYLNIAVNQLSKHPFSLNKEELRFFINEIRKKGFPAIHHSESYRNLYNPHYRVIPFVIWSKYALKN